jgi:hypothetical protein
MSEFGDELKDTLKRMSNNKSMVIGAIVVGGILMATGLAGSLLFAFDKVAVGLFLLMGGAGLVGAYEVATGVQNYSKIKKGIVIGEPVVVDEVVEDEVTKYEGKDLEPTKQNVNDVKKHFVSKKAKTNDSNLEK